MGGYVALTGIPGTGKSSVARVLPGPDRSVEVGDLAIEARAGRRSGRGVQVDLARLGRWIRTHRARGATVVVTGHLAHLLPIHDVVLLRCHPVELLARLRAARRGAATDRTENVLAETTDVILAEAIRLRRRVWEVDTTGRPPEDVAREVVRLLRERPAPRYGTVNWLADPLVTDYLLPALR